MFDLFGESDLPIHDRLLEAYEHRDGWVNRLVLGDSLVVMNSLLHYEGLGGQVQTIYMDPPYAVKFGSNFQPFVRKRDVTHGADDDMVREPEMVQAHRDTWELGVHSFLTYLRDRLLLARELLHPSGSIFVQMSDTNLHHVREVMDEVFGAECFVSQISFQTTSGFQTRTLATLGDFLLWYARDPERLKVRKLFGEQPVVLGEGNARWVLLPDGSYRGVSAAYVQASMDLVMGDLLKNLRSSQNFSVCGLPDVRIERSGDGEYRVELLGLDVFDPVAMDSEHREGNDVPAWFLDTDYNGLCFHVCQAFFPRTSAWDGLERSLRTEFDDSVWTHPSGTASAPFDPGEHGQIAVKVVDDRGNELMVVKPLSEAEAEA